MPLKATRAKTKKGRNRVVSANIKELHSGKTYARTARKFGKAKANKQAIAIAINASKPKKRRRK